ncbi:Hypothetical_protein [Hexamita inflata]|uniref:Hypothetical_protein n=1 Tax=Hexamita inflata TaxID=28002 RepID=A0AA86P677_9EUKA|nr:Hypothetical protein HINF_LOCUS19106 [Hexamita inflata]
MQLLIKFDITQICTQPYIRLVRRGQRQVYKQDWNTVNHANFCNRQRMMLFVSTINSTLCYHICCTHILEQSTKFAVTYAHKDVFKFTYTFTLYRYCDRVFLNCTMTLESLFQIVFQVNSIVQKHIRFDLSSQFNLYLEVLLVCIFLVMTNDYTNITELIGFNYRFVIRVV